MTRNKFQGNFLQIYSSSSHRDLWTCNAINAVSRFWVVVDRRYDFSRRRDENDLSADAVEAGSTYSTASAMCRRLTAADDQSADDAVMAETLLIAACRCRASILPAEISCNGASWFSKGRGSVSASNWFTTCDNSSLYPRPDAAHSIADALTS